VGSPGRSGLTVHATSPVRICDIGGWTDTWFAGHGRVFNIAVSPRVEVRLETYPRGALENRIVLHVENYQDRYAFAPGDHPGRHPLLEAIVDRAGLPSEIAAAISIRSEVPPGSSTGTSAAVSVALIGALDVLTPGRLTPYQLATAAHRIEVDALGQESGVQDQLCAAFGGINFIDVSPYPRATVSQLRVPAGTRAELESRLLLVYLGRSHVSSQTHDKVIAALAAQTTKAAHVLNELRAAAVDARDAVLAADYPGLGRALRRNNEAQESLHPGVISADAHAVMEIAAWQDALGWKVNGAGGEGGSITVLCDPGDRRRELVRALRAADRSFQVIPVALTPVGFHATVSSNL
jgi:D-glycero-alpha-D-manno-heptose-7-phosphate kinase